MEPKVVGALYQNEICWLVIRMVAVDVMHLKAIGQATNQPSF
jgi:hypothetical protein